MKKTTWFWETGLDSRYRYISAPFETLTGIPSAKALGLSIAELWQADDCNHQSVTTLQKLMTTRRPFENIELYCKHPDGTGRTFQTIGEPMFDSAEAWRGYRGIAVDMSAHTQTETALRDAIRVAEQADTMKTRLLMAASHDLQQPLQTVSTISTLLARMIEEPEARRHVDALGETVESMRTMLTVLLDVTRPQTDLLNPQVRNFPVNQVLAQMQTDFCYPAAEKRLVFRVVPSHALLRSDPHLVQEIVRNLVANAVKYTDHGKVLLGCRWCNGAVRIEVWDTGIGIDEAQRQHIFEEFYQLDKTADDPRRGLGLGLAIVEHLARLLGLAVDFQSTPGKGSMFAVTVPLAASLPAITRDSETIPAANAAGHAASILYVEDNPGVLDATQFLLKLEGFTVFAANSGKQATNLLRECALQPDVIVCDYRLPAGVIGLDIIEHVRRAMGVQIPAILITGDGSGQSAGLAKRLGCETLRKPVDGGQLVSAIHRLLGGSSSVSSVSAIERLSLATDNCRLANAGS